MKQTQQLLIEKLKKDLRFGIEIEAITSVRLDKADYHSNYEEHECNEGCDEECSGSYDEMQTYGKYFYAESDGSLDNWKNCSMFPNLCPADKVLSYRSGSTVELITQKPFMYHEIDTILDDLEKSMQEHKATLFFNSSCGSHVHVSLKGHQLQEVFDTPQIFAFRRRVFKGMKEYFNDNNKFKEWKSYYFRKYAKKITKQNNTRFKRNERYSEANRTLENRIEFRSLHLMGIHSFEEMKKVYKIFFDAIIYALSYKPIKQNIVTTTTEYITIATPQIQQVVIQTA